MRARHWCSVKGPITAAPDTRKVCGTSTGSGGTFLNEDYVGAFEALQFFDDIAGWLGRSVSASPGERRPAVIFWCRWLRQLSQWPLLSDQKFYALGLPAFGPGRTRRFDPTARDVGRMGESDDIKDAYRFKTPRLCNIALTAPCGHNGAYRDLYGIVRHHLDSAAMRAVWQPNLAALPAVPWLEAIDFVIQSDSAKLRVRRRNWILKR